MSSGSYPQFAHFDDGAFATVRTEFPEFSSPQEHFQFPAGVKKMVCGCQQLQVLLVLCAREQAILLRVVVPVMIVAAVL